jgi:uncharacterized membrane protein
MCVAVFIKKQVSTFNHISYGHVVDISINIILYIIQGCVPSIELSKHQPTTQPAHTKRQRAVDLQYQHVLQLR